MRYWDKFIYEYYWKLYGAVWIYLQPETQVYSESEVTIPVTDWDVAFEIFVARKSETVFFDYLQSSTGVTVLDVGANIGLHSCIAAESDKNTVYAIEPHPLNYQLLSRNTPENVEPSNLALSNTTGYVQFPDTDSVDGSTQLPEITNDETGVKVVTGDTFVEQKNTPPDIIKIDVEGCEGQVLEGLSDTLSKLCHAVLLEVHHPNPNAERDSITEYGYAESDLVSMLEDHGFERYKTVQRQFETQYIYIK